MFYRKHNKTISFFNNFERKHNEAICCSTFLNDNDHDNDNRSDNDNDNSNDNNSYNNNYHRKLTPAPLIPTPRIMFTSPITQTMNVVIYRAYPANVMLARAKILRFVASMEFQSNVGAEWVRAEFVNGTVHEPHRSPFGPHRHEVQ